MTEELILNRLSSIRVDKENVLKEVRRLRAELVTEESLLIELNLEHERLTEQLRLFRENDPKYVPDERDLEIEEFRKKFPDLCQK